MLNSTDQKNQIYLKKFKKKKESVFVYLVKIQGKKKKKNLLESKIHQVMYYKLKSNYQMI